MKSEAKKNLNIAIIYGGKSCEHDISVITACLAKGYFRGNLFSVYLDKKNRAYLVGNDWTPRDHMRLTSKKRVTFLPGEGSLGLICGRHISKLTIDVAVNCCHGLCGEDGCVAALCKMCGIPLVGSDVAPSAVAMDKILTKHILQNLCFPVVKGVAVTHSEAENFCREQQTFPLIVKPSLLGSSIGVKIAHDAVQLRQALGEAFRYCPQVLVEEALTDFCELNCAAMRADGKVLTSNVECPTTVNELLTFNDKYVSNTAEPSHPIAEEVRLRVQQLTEEIYEKLGFGGVIRVDFLLSRSGELFVNEINTTPGSLAFGLWEGHFSRKAYGEALVDQAVADYREMQSFTYTFDSTVLDGGSKLKK